MTSLCKWPITRDTKTNYVIIGSLTPRTKAWFLYAADVSATQLPVPSGLLPGRIRTWAAGMPAKLNSSQLRRHAGGKDWDDDQCCRPLLFSYRNSIQGSTGGYVASASAAYENQA